MKRSKHELKRLIEAAVADIWQLRGRNLWLVVDELETSGRPPETVTVWATLHFLPGGSPFCCGEPGCHLDLSPGGLESISERLRLDMGLRQPVAIDFGERTNVNYEAGVTFHYGALESPDRG